MLDKENLILLCIYVLISLMFGSSLFFTFVVGPALFSGLDKKTAGYAMNLIFPYYFKIGWIGGIVVYTLSGLYVYLNKSAIKFFKRFLAGLFLAVILSMALDRAVLPVATGLLSEYYDLISRSSLQQADIVKEKFDTVHRVSVYTNIIYTVIMFYLLYLMFKFFRNTSTNQ